MRSPLLKNLLLTFAGLSLLTSCVDFNGQIVVNEKLVVKEKRKSVVVPAGVYSAKLAVKSKRKLKLTVQNSVMKKTATIKLKKGYKLPSYDGDFNIPASVLGQEFNIKGNKRTNVSRSSSVNKSQHCSVRRVRTKCEKVCEIKVIKLPNGGTRRKKVCKRVCRDTVRQIPGSKLVTYHYKTVKQRLELTLVDKSSLAAIADYSGGNTSTSTVYDHVGACRIGRHRY